MKYKVILIMNSTNSSSSKFNSGAMRGALSSVLPWIRNSQSIMIRGPAGCGKSALISVVLSSIRSVEQSTLIKCSSLYGPQDLVTKLKRGCVQLNSSSHGRTYKPRNGSRVVLIVEDVHLASNDLQVACLVCRVFKTSFETIALHVNAICLGTGARIDSRRRISRGRSGIR